MTSEFHSDMHSVSASDIDFRLPPEVKPVHYDLYLHPDLKKGTFKGRVIISIDILKKQKFLALHQLDLKIDSVSLYKYDASNKSKLGNQSLENIEIKESYPISEKQVFVVVPKEDLTIGRYDLKLSFIGSLQNRIFGFYSSKYRDEFNNTR